MNLSQKIADLKPYDFPFSHPNLAQNGRHFSHGNPHFLGMTSAPRLRPAADDGRGGTRGHQVPGLLKEWGGGSINRGTPIAGYFILWKIPNKQLMMTGGTPILGIHHV